MLWDIFCRVIDNYGDIGVCWRLSANLAARGQEVRLWVDDASALDWMAPGARQGHWQGVTVLPWEQALDDAAPWPASQVWVEGFGCELPPAFVARGVAAASVPGAATPVWINLEYLSAEPYVARNHRLQSPVLHGLARGWHKTFFYPGFGSGTGGLLREPDLLTRRQAFSETQRQLWLERHAPGWHGERVISLFCYPHAPLQPLLAQLAAAPQPTLLLVAHGAGQAAVRAALKQLALPAAGAAGGLHVQYLPPLPQPQYDLLLWCCDLNFVRGEDSLVRALWAGKPFVWNIYAQDDGAHAAKLHAFLRQTRLGPLAEACHLAWNGLGAPQAAAAALQPLCTQGGADGDSPPAWAEWQDRVLRARAEALSHPDLASALRQFVLQNG